MSKTLVKPGSPRSAVVTGAGRGIGRAIAIELKGRGYEVIVTDIDAQAAETTAREIDAPSDSGSTSPTPRPTVRRLHGPRRSLRSGRGCAMPEWPSTARSPICRSSRLA